MPGSFYFRIRNLPTSLELWSRKGAENHSVRACDRPPPLIPFSLEQHLAHHAMDHSGRWWGYK
jgi:hypothetical protein